MTNYIRILAKSDPKFIRNENYFKVSRQMSILLDSHKILSPASYSMYHTILCQKNQNLIKQHSYTFSDKNFISR